jgi:hypothetical protein
MRSAGVSRSVVPAILPHPTVPSGTVIWRRANNLLCCDLAAAMAHYSSRIRFEETLDVRSMAPSSNEEVIMKEIEVGRVTDYFAHIGVVAIEVTAEGIKVGDTLRFKGHTTDFTQKITSMQVEHAQVEEAPVGSSVGIKVKDRVRTHDEVLKVIED